MLILVAAVIAPGQQPAHRSSIVIIRAGRLLDVKTGKLLPRKTILVEDEKIVSVGKEAQIPKGATVIDLSNATVLPGLIDAHTHLTYSLEFRGYSELGISAARKALIGARNARVTLEAGFTTVRNVDAPDYADVALRDAINAGDVPGPRMQVSGPALGITGGHCDTNLLPFEYHATDLGVADGVGAVQHKTREVIKYGADLIKICASGGVLTRGDNPRHAEYTLEEMKAIVADAHRLGRKVAAHAHSTDAILWATQAGVDSIEHGSFIDDAGIAEMKKNGTYLVPTLYLPDWLMANAGKIGLRPAQMAKAKEVNAVKQKNIARAFAAGIKIGFGTDAGVYPHGLNAHEFAAMVQLGMSPLLAIQAATIRDAELLGWSDKIGTIERGKFADIIAVDGDPLADITSLQRVRFVMKSGKVVKNDYVVTSVPNHF